MAKWWQIVRFGDELSSEILILCGYKAHSFHMHPTCATTEFYTFCVLKRLYLRGFSTLFNVSSLAKLAHTYCSRWQNGGNATNHNVTRSCQISQAPSAASASCRRLLCWRRPPPGPANTRLSDTHSCLCHRLAVSIPVDPHTSCL